LAERVLSAYTAKNPGGRITHAYVFLHAPWITSDSFHAKKTFEKETKIDAAIIRGITKDMQGQYTPRSPDRPCEAAVTKISLNEYPTDTPEGKYAHTVEIDALFSSCNADSLQRITSAVRSAFGTPEISIRSSERALLAALAHTDPEQSMFVVELGIEDTNLLIVRSGVGDARASIPEGLYSIIKRIAPSGMPEETRSTLRMIARSECSTTTCQSTIESIAKIEPELARVIGSTLSQIAARERIPTSLLLLCPEEITEWLTSFFGRIDFAPFTVTTLPFEVHTPRISDFSKTFTAAPGVTIDQSIALYTVLVNNEIQAT